MRLWRICRAPYAKAALSGDGGLRASGRWHHRGHRVSYCAEHASLAALEMLVHFDASLAPHDLVLVQIDVPARIKIRSLEEKALPRNWRRTPAPRKLQDLGTSWLISRESAVMSVPSAVMPHELNFLLNPEHSDATRISVVSTRAFAFDQRLAAKR